MVFKVVIERWNLFCLFFLASITGKSLFSFFYTACRFSYLSIVPSMSCFICSNTATVIFPPVIILIKLPFSQSSCVIACIFFTVFKGVCACFTAYTGLIVYGLFCASRSSFHIAFSYNLLIIFMGCFCICRITVTAFMPMQTLI